MQRHALILVAAMLPLAALADQPDLGTLAREAVSEDPSQAAAAIAALRRAGQPGLDALFEAHRETLDIGWRTPHANPWSRISTPERERVASAIDAVAAARHSDATRLFWHTDLSAAQAESRETGKPILSLRLLGRLDEDLSCANSRFFRVALYPDERVCKLLRDRFVLHWQSVRAAPVITIDFGDGRKLERTITGNSIHYVLDEKGRVIDGMPGLIAPKRFAAWLDRVAALHETLRPLTDPSRDPNLRRYHEARLREITDEWSAALARLDTPGEPTLVDFDFDGGSPTALEAAPLAVSKAAAEIDVVRLLSPLIERLERRTDTRAWSRMAEQYAGEARVDEACRRVMRELCGVRIRSQQQFEEVVASFERSLAQDSLLNELVMHRRIHERLAQRGAAAASVDELNRWVYAELFLTPDTDPWLGLAGDGTFAALPDNGLIGR